MVSSIIHGVEVNRPQPDPIPSSILDHATVVDNPKFGLQNNEGLWPSYNCLDTLVPTPTCARPLVEVDFKTFATAEWVPAFEFAVHGGVQCAAIGLDKTDMFSEIQRVFEASEAKGVEQALMLNRFVATDSDADVQWDAPVEVMSGVLPIATALAVLEGYAATVYAGVPTLHLPRSVVLLAFGKGLLVEEGGKYYTKTGAKVASGGGYDDQGGTVGEWDLYATGEVYVERSDKVAHSTFVLPGDGSGTGSDENGLEQNTEIALVERMYRVAIDCFVAKVTAGATLTVEGSL